jgi:hypothetical protein
MAVHSLELESVPPARSRHSARWLLIAAVVIVALAVGSAGTIGYQYLRWLTGASATNAQAARISNELTAQLSAAVFAPGEATGHVRIEADLVNLVENSGGILLSFTTISAAGDNVADVMLGLLSLPGSETPAASYQVRCYSYTFANTPPVQQAGIRCPVSRTDGQPGSVQAQMGELLAIKPVKPQPNASYPLNLQGAQQFLAKSTIVGTPLSPAPALSTQSGGGYFAAAFQRNGACFFLRMSDAVDAPSGEADDLWLAPADEQAPGACKGEHALAASGLYGPNTT